MARLFHSSCLVCRYRDCVFAGGILDFGFCSEEGKKEEAVEVKKFAKTIARQLVPGETELTGNHKEMLGQWQAERAPQRWKTAGESQQKKSLGFCALFLLCCRETGGQGKGRKKGGETQKLELHTELSSVRAAVARIGARANERERDRLHTLLLLAADTFP